MNSYKVGKINHAAKHEGDQHESVTVAIRTGQWLGSWRLDPNPIALTVSEGLSGSGSISLTNEEAKELARILTTAVERGPDIAAEVLAIEERRGDLDEAEQSLIATMMQTSPPAPAST